MHRFSIAVLRVLDKKHHEKGDDRRGSVDHQLPGIGKMKHWSGENQTRMTSTAPAKAQALPRAIEEWRAKTRNASLARQKRSRGFSCFSSFSVWVFITASP